MGLETFEDGPGAEEQARVQRYYDKYIRESLHPNCLRRDFVRSTDASPAANPKPESPAPAPDACSVTFTHDAAGIPVLPEWDPVWDSSEGAAVLNGYFREMWGARGSKFLQ